MPLEPDWLLLITLLDTRLLVLFVDSRCHSTRRRCSVLSGPFVELKTNQIPFALCAHCEHDSEVQQMSLLYYCSLMSFLAASPQQTKSTVFLKSIAGYRKVHFLELRNAFDFREGKDKVSQVAFHYRTCFVIFHGLFFSERGEESVSSSSPLTDTHSIEILEAQHKKPVLFCLP